MYKNTRKFLLFFIITSILDSFISLPGWWEYLFMAVEFAATIFFLILAGKEEIIYFMVIPSVTLAAIFPFINTTNGFWAFIIQGVSYLTINFSFQFLISLAAIKQLEKSGERAYAAYGKLVSSLLIIDFITANLYYVTFLIPSLSSFGNALWYTSTIIGYFIMIIYIIFLIRSWIFLKRADRKSR